MVTVVSRFRVANGMDEDVALAFRNRPRLVEAAPGFLGLEVVRDVEDPSIFQLITRWTDIASFKNWHGSDAHRASHSGIPKGLRLDPSCTRIDVLRDTASGALDWPDFVTGFIAEAESVYCLEIDAEDKVYDCNPAFAQAIKTAPADLKGVPVCSLLVEADRDRLRSELTAGTSGHLMLNFVDAQMAPFSVRARLFRIGTMHRLIAEPAVEPLVDVGHTILGLNNELARLSRDNVQKNRELEKTRGELARALHDLETSFWHIRKVQELLPICMVCNKVSAGATAWEDVAEYLKKNSLFLTHGICPECAAKMGSEL